MLQYASYHQTVQEYLCEVVAAITDKAVLMPIPSGEVKEAKLAKVVASAAGIGYEPVPEAAAVVVNETHKGSVVSMLAMMKPCLVAAAVKAFWAAPPEAMVPEQSARVTLTTL